MHTIKNVVIILIIIIIIVICILLIQPKQTIELFDAAQFASKIIDGGTYNWEIDIDPLNIIIPDNDNPEIPFNFGAGLGQISNALIATAETGVNAVKSTIDATIATIETQITAIQTQIQKPITALTTIKNNLANLEAANATKIDCLFKKLLEHIKNTLTLLGKFSTKTGKFSPILTKCIIDILSNVNKIIHTLFTVDINKFKGDEYNVVTKLKLIGIRINNLFNKLGSLIGCINIFIIIIGKRRNIIEIAKIFKFLFTTLLIDTWKYTQYTIKYTLIDLHSTNPLLSEILSQEIYKESIHIITMSSLQITRATIDFSELFIYVGINIIDLINFLLDIYKYLKSSATQAVNDIANATGGLNADDMAALTALMTVITEAIADMSPLPSSKNFGVLDIVSLKTTIKLFRSILIKIGCVIDDTLCSSISTPIKIHTGCEYDPISTPAVETTTAGTKSLKETLRGISEKFIQCKDTTNLNNYYCSLEINTNIKTNINSIEKNINSTHNALYLSIYAFFIDISKPHGWSYEENKTHIEDLIDIKKLN